jgi:hypothetical protein
MADKTFTAEEFATWIPAREAYRRAQEAYGAQAASTILSRCATGLMHGRAENIFIGSGSRRKEYGFDALIPARVWEELDDERYPSSLTLWNTNAIELEIRPDAASLHTPSVSWKLFGIRFDPVEVDKMMPPKAMPAQGKIPEPPAAAPVSTTLPSAKHAGGAPPKAFWDDLWAAVAASLYDGSLIPDKQATIEKAMLDWATAYGHELSVQSVRSRARKLYALVKKDKN